ncbi:MAG: LysM peptidoglycan-binding domain-containing protein [Eubacterium sp.]|nr:LysM peptidoglycan-binding domain-containing protein [Eubacterium sp.]
MAEQKQRASGTLPKNIRQIGTSTGSTRVYLEDYVYTYLHTQEANEAWTNRAFILLGRVERGKDQTRFFISGCIRVEDAFCSGQMLEFSDETWAFIYKEMKTYYDNLEIVGWGQDIGNASTALAAELEHRHKQYFNIQKNVLFLLNQAEQEEAFYVFEKNILQRREGYYVYYEKNPQMQDYMIEKSKSRELDISPEEIQEPLVRSYRETLLEKKAQMAERKWNGVLYTTSLLLVLSVCVLGVSTVNNVEKMQDLESAVNQISGKGGQAGIQSSDVPAMSANVQDEDSSDLKEVSKDGEPKDDKQTADQESSDDTGQDSKEESDSTGQDSTAGDSGSTGQDGKAGESGSTGQTDEAGESGDTEQAANGSSKEEKNASSEKAGSSSKKGQKTNTEGSYNDPSESQEASTLTEAQTSLLQGYYIVKKGDSLVGISKKIYGTAAKARKICQLNGIDDMDKIYAGQKLELP